MVVGLLGLAALAALAGCPSTQQPGDDDVIDAAVDADPDALPIDAGVDAPPQPVCAQPVPTCTVTIRYQGAAPPAAQS